jgi:hypothetical protein
MALGNLTPTSTDYGVEDHSWLGSAHGTDTADSITLDGDAMVAVFTDGNVPSGVVLGMIDESGLYGPYDGNANDGTEDALGHLLTRRSVKAGESTAGALFWHGQVIEENLPDNNGLDEGAKAALTHIHYV